MLRRLPFLALALLAASWLLPPSGALAQDHGGGGEGPHFVKMEPFNATIFDRGASRGRIVVELQLDVLENDRLEAVEARLPRLYDGFLAAVTDYAGTRAAISPPTSFSHGALPALHRRDPGPRRRSRPDPPGPARLVGRPSCPGAAPSALAAWRVSRFAVAMGNPKGREGQALPEAPAPDVPSGDEALLLDALAASQMSVLEWDCGGDRLSVRGPFWSQIARPAPEAPSPLAALLDIVEGADRPGLEAAIRRAAEAPGDFRDIAEFRVQAAVGDVREFTLGVGRVPGAGSTFVAGVIRDATEDRRLRRDLMEARNAAKAANEAKSDFLATISHEIRTPINGILGMVGLLLDTDLNAEQRDFASVVQESGQALLEIVTDILDFAKIEAGRVELEHIDFDLAEVVAGVVRLLGPRARSKGLTLKAELQRLPHVAGDPGRVRQVLLNLIGNAVKFTEKGGVTVRCRILGKVDGVLSIRGEVEDTGVGIGIGTEARNKLFRRFSQVDSSVARWYGGTGLGLAVSKSLVDLMGGDIGVESVLGEGSTFWFEVPLMEAGRPVRTARPAAGRPRRRSPVLVVDDNPVNQRLLVALLDRMGFRTEVAATGPEAVASVRRGAFGLVLMDLELPGMDGWAAAAEIRGLPGARAGVPILAVTADVKHGDRERYRHSAINDYLLKPVDRDELTMLVWRWIGARVAPGEAPGHEAPGHEAPVGDGTLIDASVVSSHARQLGDDKVGELIDLYVTDLNERLTRIAAAVEARHQDRLLQEVHDLRSTSGSLGLSRLFALGGDIQVACSEGKLDRALAIAAELPETAQRTVAALDAQDPRNARSAKPRAAAGAAP